MIEIGKAKERGLVGFDLPTLIESRLLLVANSGGGKSWALRRLLEQSNGQVQQLVIDIEGEFATLRERFDYILAGKNGDTPAQPKTAALLARRLMEIGVSAICDLSEIHKYERPRFVKLFVEALIEAPKDLRHPIMVVIDEAHQFCPEKGEAESASAIIDLCTRGRKRGLCAVLATQRISKLHKDACAETLNKLVGRTGLDIDQQRAGDELGMIKSDRLQLRNLPPGEFFVFGPALRIGDNPFQGVSTVSVGKIQTKHPTVGDREFSAPPVMTAKIRSAIARMADLPGEADRDIRDNEALRKEVASLRRQLSAGVKPCDHGPILSAMQQRDKQLTKRLTDLSSMIDRLSRSVKAGYEASSGSVIDIKRLASDDLAQTAIAVLNSSRVMKPPATGKACQLAGEKVIKASENVYLADATSAIGLPPGERAVLTAAIQHGGVDRKALTVLTGYKRSSRDAYIQRLLSKGLVEVHGSVISPTDLGTEALAGSAEPLPVGQELIDYWMDRLPEGEKKTLAVLVEASGSDVARAMIDEQTGYMRSSRDAYLQRLKARGLVEFCGPGTVRAAKLLFGEGQ